MRFMVLGTLSLAGCEIAPPYGREDRPWEQHPVMRLPPGNIRITLDTFRFSEEESAAIDIAARYADAKAVLAVGDPLARNGFRVIAGTRNFVAGFRAETKTYRSQSHQSGFIVVADGRRASMITVRQMAAFDAVSIPVYEGELKVRTVRVVPTGTGFSVEAKILDNGSVDLHLAPWILDENGAELVFAELRTHLLVEPGRPYAITGMSRDTVSVGSALFSLRTQAGRFRMLQVVTVEVP